MPAGVVCKRFVHRKGMGIGTVLLCEVTYGWLYGSGMLWLGVQAITITGEPFQKMILKATFALLLHCRQLANHGVQNS